MSSREEFEYEAGKALSLPVSIIEQARKGDRYDHYFDSMSLMQPLNGWWHWWQAGREGLESRLKSAESNDIDARCHVAELEAKCAALAAENAGLKDINAWCKTDAFKNMYREFKTAEALGCHDVDCMHDAMLTAIMNAPETPATDAFLAEVRAQGVDIAIAELNQLAQRSEKEAPIAAEHHRSAALYLQLFAAQLRQEAAK